MIKFVIPLDSNPVPHQNNIRYSRYGARKTARLRGFQEYIAFFVKSEMNKKGLKILQKTNFSLKIKFFLRNKKHGDGTNIYKSIEDSLEGVLYCNDRYNVDGGFTIDYDSYRPRLEIFFKIH